MKKKYLSDVIDYDFERWVWNSAKVIISAPLGMGKSSFVCHQLLDVIRKWRSLRRHEKDKLLILCNRKLLRKQYFFTLLEKNCSARELQEIVEVMTYQELAAKIGNCGSVNFIFLDYSCIVLDEVHYFVSDSDFNGFGTFALFNAIIRAGILKCLFFMSATMEEVTPLIYQVLKDQIKEYKAQHNYCPAGCEEIIERNYHAYRDFNYVRAYFIKDEKELCHKIRESQEKWIIFIDSKKRGQSLSEMISAESKNVTLLHAENLEQETDFIYNLTMNGVVRTDVLITTAVLDNGVSIHDSAVKNIVIRTDSKVSFLQMLGRIRVNDGEEVRLFFYETDPEHFRRHAEASQKLLTCFDDAIRERRNYKTPGPIVRTVWQNPYSSEAEILRKTYVLVDSRADYIYSKYAYEWLSDKVVRKYCDSGLYINEFSLEKARNQYRYQMVLYKRAMACPQEVAREQLRWMGKDPDELIILEADYIKEKEKLLKAEFESFRTGDKESLAEFKKHICREFGEVIGNYVTINKGTISREKLIELCNVLGFVLDISTIHGKAEYKIYKKDT